MRKPKTIVNLLNEIYGEIAKHPDDFLIGSVNVDDITYVELLDFVESLISGDIYIMRDEKSAIISAALVLFAISEYQGGQFWNEFATRLGSDEAEVVKIGKKSFEDFCDKNGLYFHVGNKNKGYVTSILVHAIIPNSGMIRFLEFLQDLYFKDLEEDYIDVEVEELIQYMKRLFAKYLEDDDISLIVQGSKMTIANQQLPKAFRIAFVKATGMVAPIIEKLLFYINQTNYSYAIEYFDNDRFDAYFKQYGDTVKETFSSSSERKSRAEHIKKFRSAEYFLEQSKLFLRVPRQIIDSDYIDNDIFLEVLNTNSVVYREGLVLTRNRLFFKTEQTVVHLPNFYPELSFRIVSGDKIIYMSGDTLYREYIIFDIDGNEIKPKQLTNDTVKVVTPENAEVLSDDALINVSFMNNYKISTVFLNEESLLLIDDKVLSTNVARIKSEICTEKRHHDVTVMDASKRAFDVYSGIPTIRLRIPYMRGISDYIISINGRNYDLKDVAQFNIRSIYDGSGDELGDILLEETIIENNNPAKIIVREKGSNRIYIEENIFIIESLEYEFNQNYYYREKEGKITYLDARGIEFQDAIFPQKVNLRKNDHFSIGFKSNTCFYRMRIDLPVLRWRLGDLSSLSYRSGDIWWEEVGERKLYIKYPRHLSSRLHITTETSHEKIQGKAIGGEHRYIIEYLFQVKNQDPITFDVILDGKEERITTIHFRPVINELSVSYFRNNSLMQGLYARWKYIGYGDLKADVIYAPTKTVIKQYTIGTGGQLFDKDINLYYGEHEVEFYQLIDDGFFGEGVEKKVLVSEKFIVGDPVIASTKKKRLRGISCRSGVQKYGLPNFYLKDIRFAKAKGLYEATGMYFIKDRFTGKNRPWYFTDHNPFAIKFISSNRNKLIFEVVDKNGEKPIYDIKTGFINSRNANLNRRKHQLLDSIEFEIIK